MSLLDITKIAAKLGLKPEQLEVYGRYKAKIDTSKVECDRPDGKLILVTAITPTKAGEGKTTCSIALSDGLNLLGKKVCLTLREPSLGPVFGQKGGATGGGRVTVEPSAEINLHFTGDMHALTAANNLIAAVIDNHIFQGNELQIDPERIVFPRAMDMNDRALREITVAEGKKNGNPRQDSFVITVATELMAILCLAADRTDFKKRLAKITVAYDLRGKPITVADLKITSAVTLLMEEALKPNLVQTSFGTPALIHGGPFANIAHGCNSIIATKLALKLADYVVTEAGFGSDLGAEKFLDIKCREAGLCPAAIVVVCTIRALKNHGGATELEVEDLEALQNGFANLQVHVENMKKFKRPVVVAINHFSADTDREIQLVEALCRQNGYDFSFTDGYIRGAEGAEELASTVLSAINLAPEEPLRFTYEMSDPIEVKIEKIAKSIYRAKDVVYLDEAKKQLEEYRKLGADRFYVCIAKTPQSLSDNAKLLNAPLGHTLHVKSLRLSTGARFVVPITGAVLTMPGLPKVPAAVKMEVEDGD